MRLPPFCFFSSMVSDWSGYGSAEADQRTCAQTLQHSVESTITCDVTARRLPTDQPTSPSNASTHRWESMPQAALFCFETCRRPVLSIFESKSCQLWIG